MRKHIRLALQIGDILQTVQLHSDIFSCVFADFPSFLQAIIKLFPRTIVNCSIDIRVPPAYTRNREVLQIAFELNFAIYYLISEYISTVAGVYPSIFKYCTNRFGFKLVVNCQNWPICNVNRICFCINRITNLKFNKKSMELLKKLKIISGPSPNLDLSNYVKTCTSRGYPLYIIEKINKNIKPQKSSINIS